MIAVGLLISLLIGFTVLYFFLSSVAKKKTSDFNVKDFTFEDLPDSKQHSIFENKEEIYLTLVVPAYNEQKRLPVMLDATLKYLEERKKSSKKPKCISFPGEEEPEFTFEIIIIDDGSKDDTSGVVKKYIKKHGEDCIKLIKLKKNRGKGFATKQGMLHGRGRFMLMLDADGATQIETALERLEAEMTKNLKTVANNNKLKRGVAIGSRAHLLEAEDGTVQRKWYRKFAKLIFILIMKSLTTVRGIKDTQCGFKLFTRQSTKDCFGNLHIDRFSFDLELLMIAQKLKTPFVEVPVAWQEIDGSKVNLLLEGFNMPRDMLLIRVFYLLGFWKINKF